MSPLNPFTGIWIFHRRSNSFNPFSTFVYIYMETRFPLKIKETEKNRTRENSILQLLLSSICFDNSTMHSFLPIFSSISSLYDRIHYFIRIVHNSKWFDDNRWRLRNERRWIFLRLKVARLKRRGSGDLEESSGTEPESPAASFRGLELLVARGTSTRTMGQRHCLAPRRYIK